MQPAAHVTGIGLFTGKDSAVTLRAGDPRSGITLATPSARTRTDIHALSTTPPHPAFANLAPRQTALRVGDHTVFTVEHLLAAIAGCAAGDVVCDVQGPEIPIDDGSAHAFARAIESIGLVSASTQTPTVIRAHATITSTDGSASIELVPAKDTRYVYELDYGPHAPIAPATVEWNGSPRDFITAIAPARTFSLAAEADAMRAAGLFTRFTPKDLLVITPDGSAIDNALRSPDEPALHKLLDLIGDLALIGGGRPIQGHIIARRSGHALNHAAARRIAAMQPNRKS
jgi:UDP-3-O-acyl N-acetylglucosamine deacetylase